DGARPFPRLAPSAAAPRARETMPGIASRSKASCNAPSRFWASRQWAQRSYRLHGFDQVAAARHLRPCRIEVGDEQLEGRGVETLTQPCHIVELVERIVDRRIAAAPEAPAFLGIELVQRKRQVVRTIPLMDFRAL